MDIQPYQSSSLPTSPSPTQTFTMSLDQTIAAWLNEKKGKSGSSNTLDAYQEGLSEFRSMLIAIGKDLDAPASLIAPLLQGWADTCHVDGRDIAPATYNQRLAIISSFYRYAMKHEVLAINPVERVERRKVYKVNAAHALQKEAVGKALKAINRETLVGKRDYAILCLALATGRRVNELASLRYGHIQRQGDIATVLWPHCKGAKTMTDILPIKTTKALYDYLSALYGQELYSLAKDAPVWVSVSDRCKGKALGTQTLQHICERYLGTSKFHTTRHTFAVGMSHSGASLQEIGKALGHSNLKTTSDYLNEQLGYENKYAATLEDMFEF